MLNPYYTPPATISPIPTSNQQPAATCSQSPTASSPATQFCQTKYNFLFCSHSILIRVPYRGSSDCDNTFHTLYGDLDQTESKADLTNWQCVEEDGYIRLWFNTPITFSASDVNQRLESCYPNVNGFNCNNCL